MDLNLVTVASPSHALCALSLLETYFRLPSAKRAVWCHFNGLPASVMERISGHFGGRVIFREVPKTCPHAYDPGVWFFKAYALVAGMELDEPFLYLDSMVSINAEPVELKEKLGKASRFYLQLPPSPELYNGCWTTRRSMQKLGCDEDRYRFFQQYVAGIQAYLPTPENKAHVLEAYRLMHDYEIGGPTRAISRPDGPGTMCVEHRGDQSVLSTLIERNGWHQPFDPELYLKYGDFATAAHYAKGFIDVSKAPTQVIQFRSFKPEIIPAALMEATKKDLGK